MTRDEAIAALAGSLARIQDDLQRARSALNALQGGDASLPPGAGTTVRVKIIEMLPPFEGVSKRTGKPFTKFKAKASDGQVYETFSESLNETLVTALGADREVELGYTESRFGRDLVSATLDDGDGDGEGDAVPPPSDDDLPF
jgi:hypothetical protein